MRRSGGNEQPTDGNVEDVDFVRNFTQTKTAMLPGRTRTP